MAYKRYEKYKDSGIALIGEIPENWQVKKLNYITKYVGSGKTPKGGAEIYTNKGVMFLRSQNIHFDSLKLDDVVYITEDINDEMVNTQIKNNDILLNITGASIGRCNIVPYKFPKANVNQHVCIIRAEKSKVEAKLLNRIISSNLIQNQIIMCQNGSSREGLNFPQIRGMKLCIPSNIKEQKEIVDFLDKKTNEIDNLIKDKENLIELLKEQRQAIITEAVTKGLDKNVSMKDSGVEYIGYIPSAWEVKKLRYLGSLQNGISKSAEYFGKGYPFVSYSDVYRNTSIPIDLSGKVESSENERRLYSLDEGDVFFTRTSETIEEIGFASTCLCTIENATFAGFLIRFRPRNTILAKGFSKYYFRSTMHRRFFVKEMNIVTRASLSQELLKQLPVIIPPIDEQERIANYLDDKTFEIDSLINDVEDGIKNLKEYKHSLISEVVTGKINILGE